MSKTQIKILILALTVAAAALATRYAARAQQGFRTPINVFPYYRYANPLSVNAGGYSETLSSAGTDGLLRLAQSIKANPDGCPVEVMFILSIRLWDQGERQRAAYWYYCAAFRTVVLAMTMTNSDRQGDYKLAPLFKFKTEMGKTIRKGLRKHSAEWASAINEARHDCRDMCNNSSLYPSLKRRGCIADSTAIAMTDYSYEQAAILIANRQR